MDIKAIICSLTDAENYRVFSNKENETYCMKISRLSDTWFYDLCDLIDFYQDTSIKVIINVEESEIQTARELYGEHRFNECILRDYESKILVHSTPWENVDDILYDKELKSWNILKTEKQGWESEPIGAVLGDIEDFSNYVMLSDIQFNNEIIVASKQKQRIDISTEQIYTPGARFYLDAEKMAKDGLLLRDGGHIKVKSRISLEKYLLWYSTTKKLGIDKETTPKVFFEKSNEMFLQLFQQHKI